MWPSPVDPVAAVSAFNCFQDSNPHPPLVFNPDHNIDIPAITGEDVTGKAARLARYSCGQALLTQAVVVRLNTVAEVVEISRATGLTASQALYNAQMIRTHSLLLRTAQRTGFLIGGRQVHLGRWPWREAAGCLICRGGGAVLQCSSTLVLPWDLESRILVFLPANCCLWLPVLHSQASAEVAARLFSAWVFLFCQQMTYYLPPPSPAFAGPPDPQRYSPTVEIVLKPGLKGRTVQWDVGIRTLHLLCLKEPQDGGVCRMLSSCRSRPTSSTLWRTVRWACTRSRCAS